MGTSTKNRSKARPSSSGAKLDSWKTIAAYLDRDPRTVQMWEKAEGFPVHRLNHLSRPSVYAFTSEIDAWMQARSGERKPPSLPGHPDLAAEPGHTSAATRWLGYGAAAVVCAGVVAGLLIASGRFAAKPAAGGSTLAVLPFQDQTSTDSLEAEGLSDAVIEDLDRIGRMPVIAWHSARVFKDSHEPLDQVASSLKASLLLQGTVARMGNQVQVTVELLAEPGNVHQWGFTYTRQASNSADDEIASAIALDVTRRITGAAPAASGLRPAIDSRARQQYLNARFYWNQRDLPGLQKAIALYRNSIEIEPRFADAYAGLAEDYDLMPDHGVMSGEEAFLRAKEAAQKALAIDPDCGEAYNGLAFATYRQDWNFARAEQYFRRAVALSPDSAVAHQWYGEFLGDMRRFDASIAELRKARDLDPFSPMVSADLADGYLHAGRLADADAELQRVLDLYPDFVPAHQYRIAVAELRGDLKSAESEAQEYYESTGDRMPLEGVTIRQLLEAGKADEARRAGERLLNPAGGAAPSPYLSAQISFAIGETDRGYSDLENAYRQHSWWLVTMLVDPGFQAVRDEPRFLDLARRVGLPVEQPSRQLAMAPQNIR